MSTDHGHGHGHTADAALARIEALSKEGVHHAGDHEGPFSLHVLGLGGAGAGIITELIGKGLDGFTALAVDIGGADLAKVADAAAASASASGIRTVELPIPTREGLSTALNRYREFLKMEYPRYYWNPNYEPWLPGDLELPKAGERVPRAVAKAIYGSEYYQNREITSALDEFAEGILASDKTPLVVVAFSLGGSTGSGIVVELARHLSNIKLGRRPWVVGLGVLPASVDEQVPDGSFFPLINELDCMIDTDKNNGVMAVWGDLYKNPFTGGFFVVPQDDVQELTGDLDKTHAYIDAGLAGFLAAGEGRHLYETLKALNWLAVPGDQWHPAIRGQQSDRWVNVLTTRTLEDAGSLTATGLVKGFTTEFAEARVLSAQKAEAAKAGEAVAAAISSVAQTRVPAVVAVDEGPELVSVVLPRASKLDLELFTVARDRYDQIEEWEEKLLMHSWLLDLGVMLCEPSIRFDGMGGECIWGCACWVVVPHAAIRGEQIDSPISLEEAHTASAAISSS
jgi:hypothetical protein